MIHVNLLNSYDISPTQPYPFHSDDDDTEAGYCSNAPGSNSVNHTGSYRHSLLELSDTTKVAEAKHHPHVCYEGRYLASIRG